jgi:hypothetical protein
LTGAELLGKLGWVAPEGSERVRKGAEQPK